MTLERVQDKLARMIQHGIRVADDKRGPDRLALSPFPADLHRDPEDRLDDFRRDIGAGAYLFQLVP